MNLHPDRAVEVLELADGSRLHYYPAFLAADADALFACLAEELDWRADTIRLYGRDIPVPRLQAWYGDPGAIYRYSGLPLEPLPWTQALTAVKCAVEQCCQARFNSVLANLYRDGADSVSWHSDDEPELGAEPLVASVSFGAERRFQVRPKQKAQGTRSVLNLSLAHGSLLLMEPAVQHNWHHQVPKTRRPIGARINLTYRRCRLSGAVHT